ncbi:sugar phosphate nucleotidyltransferase [Candidatus Pelagibacter sp.]|nr:sugar phosphate nucleotidyltransferase [Candidatus Pelagibacter sp.]
MKVVILCGGLGSRLSEETKKIPKPMVNVGKIPILVHIMNIYSKYGYNDFILALGYKKNIINNYFKKNTFKNWNIKLVDTGYKTLTGKRLLKIRKYLSNDENFLLTYGDGVSDINLNNLINFHNKSKKVATVTAVRPPARFGQLQIKKNVVTNFDEKNQINTGWINGGYFIFNKRIFKYIPNSNTMLERDTMINLTKNNQISAYKHSGFWQCMDTLRDKELLNEIWKKNKKKW